MHHAAAARRGEQRAEQAIALDIRLSSRPVSGRTGRPVRVPSPSTVGPSTVPPRQCRSRPAGRCVALHRCRLPEKQHGPPAGLGEAGERIGGPGEIVAVPTQAERFSYGRKTPALGESGVGGGMAGQRDAQPGGLGGLVNAGYAGRRAVWMGHNPATGHEQEIVMSDRGPCQWQGTRPLAGGEGRQHAVIDLVRQWTQAVGGGDKRLRCGRINPSKAGSSPLR